VHFLCGRADFLVATEVEGIFRLAGAERRIKELQAIFNSPERYGKGLDWTGYTVHDAANVLRRYLNLLPEPIVPREFYARFREPLLQHQAEAVGEKEGQGPDIGNFDIEGAIRTYQQLITEIPPLNRQLLLYLLDLPCRLCGQGGAKSYDCTQFVVHLPTGSHTRPVA